LDTTHDAVAIHRRVGYLPGEFALYDRLTGGQTLQYFANLRGGVDRAYQRSLTERFDLDPSRRFREYSKGNKQKVGLVVALQHRPELLVLDEPPRASTRWCSRRSSKSCARRWPRDAPSSSPATSSRR